MAIDIIDKLKVINIKERSHKMCLWIFRNYFFCETVRKSLADSMKAFFPSDALLGRNGGDEFCILLPNCTFKEADKQLQQFTKLPSNASDGKKAFISR